MKTQTSSQMAESFKSGTIYPIAEKMISEFNDLGLQENKVLNRHQFASYLLGYLAGKIANAKFQNEVNYGFMDRLLVRQNKKKPAQFKNSLIRKDFVESMMALDQKNKNIYATLLTEEFENDEADDVKVLAAFFNQRSKNND